MKYKLFFVILFFLIQNSSQVKSDMTERQIFTELFNGCVKDGDPNMTLGVQFEYCACIISSMSTGLTYDLNENLGRIAESNERSAESLLQIQRMMFALVVLVIIITLINIGFLILM